LRRFERRLRQVPAMLGIATEALKSHASDATLEFRPD
jgi:hypothetical protein